MNHFIKLLVFLSVNFLFVSQSIAQSNADTVQKQGIVLSGVPQKIDKNARYLIYLSGYIVHAGDLRPTSPKFGVYEYEQILNALKQSSGSVVISEARPQTEDIESYAAKVAEQVRQMLKSGVPPQNISVVGASQGGWIAMLMSTYLKNRDLNYVVIGACGADDGFLKLVDLHGSLLFIVEKTDRFPISSCQRFSADATGLVDYKELEVNTGQQHGFLYRPMKEWIEPAVEWGRTHSKGGAGNRLEQELMQLQRAVNEAETKKDFVALDRLLADGYIFTAPNGGISDKKQLIEDLKNAPAEAGQTINYEDVKVFDYGNAAVLNCLMIVKGKDKDGKDYTNRYRNTITWVKQQDRWRMAAIHVSRIRT